LARTVRIRRRLGAVHHLGAQLFADAVRDVDVAGSSARSAHGPDGRAGSGADPDATGPVSAASAASDGSRGRRGYALGVGPEDVVPVESV